MNVRTRLQKLEEVRPPHMSAREMSTPDLEAIVRSWFGHDPSDEELANLATSDEDLHASR